MKIIRSENYKAQSWRYNLMENLSRLTHGKWKTAKSLSSISDNFNSKSMQQ